MTSGFVWRVKGVYTQPDDGAESFFSPGAERHFECLVITHDPQAHDVPALAFEMRIGGQEHWERYNAQVTSMKLLGWAQGSREEAAVSTEPPKVELWSKTAPWDSVSWMAKFSWKVSAQEVAESAAAVISTLTEELAALGAFMCDECKSAWDAREEDI